VTGTNIVSSGIRGRAKEMLSLGIPASAVAARLGVTDSMISQLLADPDFAASVQEATIESSDEDQQFDNLLQKTELESLQNISNKIKFGNLQQSLVAFRTLNGARKRRDSSILATQPVGSVVQISMPVVLIPTYVMNARSEIVEVDGQVMASASPKRLDEIVQQKTGVAVTLKQEKLEQAKHVLESVVRSVVMPARRPVRQLGKTDLVDLL